MEQDILYFICIELIYLLIFLLFNFTNSKLFYWLACIIAGIKYSIAALDSIDIITYNKVYDSITQNGIKVHDTYGIEGGYLTLLYVAKQIYTPVSIIHLITIFIVLLSINYLLDKFIPKKTASRITLFFGFFAVGGELFSYLLRQLLSSGIVFFSIGLLLKNKNKKAFTMFLSSFVFHSIPIFFTPIFISSFFKTKKTKIIIGFLILFCASAIISNTEVGSFFTSSLTGESSVYSAKYLSYSNTEGFREANRTGIFAFTMLIYFIFILSFKLKKNLTSYLSIFYFCTIYATLFSFYIEFIGAFWLSTRISFISRMLIFVSNIILTINLVKNSKLVITAIAIFVFIGSCLTIFKGYHSNGIYRLPF
jgi:hypothetical protein